MDCKGWLSLQHRGCKGYMDCKGWLFLQHRGCKDYMDWLFLQRRDYTGYTDCSQHMGCKQMMIAEPWCNSQVLPVLSTATRVALKPRVQQDKIAPCLQHLLREVPLAASPCQQGGDIPQQSLLRAIDCYCDRNYKTSRWC